MAPRQVFTVLYLKMWLISLENILPGVNLLTVHHYHKIKNWPENYGSKVSKLWNYYLKKQSYGYDFFTDLAKIQMYSLN